MTWLRNLFETNCTITAGGRLAVGSEAAGPRAAVRGRRWMEFTSTGVMFRLRLLLMTSIVLSQISVSVELSWGSWIPWTNMLLPREYCSMSSYVRLV